MIERFFSAFLLVMLMLMLGGATSCDRQGQEPQVHMSKDELIELNRRRASNEQNLLEDWVQRSGWPMIKTKTGMHIDVYASVSGDSVLGAEAVGITYKAYLLDSTLVQDTGAEVLYFRIGHDDVISGLHEAVTLLTMGDSARIIVPSYLAYGLTGNHPTIPPNAPLLYDLCLVDIR